MPVEEPSVETVAKWLAIVGMHTSANWHSGRRPIMAGIGRAGDTLFQVALEVPVYEFKTISKEKEFVGAISVPDFLGMADGIVF